MCKNLSKLIKSPSKSKYLIHKMIKKLDNRNSKVLAQNIVLKAQRFYKIRTIKVINFPNLMTPLKINSINKSKQNNLIKYDTLTTRHKTNQYK